GVLSALSPSGGGGGEYVVDAFLEDDERIRSMIRTLLALELWRTRVLFRDGGDGEEGGQCREKEEEEVVEFEVEGGSRLDEEYDSLNDVDGGEGPASGECNAAASSTPNANNNNGNAANDAASTFGGLAPRLAANGNVLRAAFVLHAETTVVSMLGLIFYRGVPPGLIEDDDGLLLSLIDYCARQLVSSFVVMLSSRVMIHLPGDARAVQPVAPPPATSPPRVRAFVVRPVPHAATGAPGRGPRQRVPDGRGVRAALAVPGRGRVRARTEPPREDDGDARLPASVRAARRGAAVDEAPDRGGRTARRRRRSGDGDEGGLGEAAPRRVEGGPAVRAARPHRPRGTAVARAVPPDVLVVVPFVVRAR
ncbi:hypothetical protein THAOC_32641, partial [Thalassiosira oceanica]